MKIFTSKSVLLSIFAIALLVSAGLIGYNIAKPDEIQSGTAGDTYQSAKVYTKIITSSVTTSASIACDDWLIKEVTYFVTPTTTAGATPAATTTVGIYNDSTTTTVATTLDISAIVTSTPTFMVTTTPEGIGQTCSSTAYIKAVTDVPQITENGMLSVEYWEYK